MGRGYTQYAFPESDSPKQEVIFSAHLDYQLPDQSLLFVHQTPCWCFTCDCFQVGECIEPLEKLESDLMRLRRGDLSPERYYESEADREFFMTYLLRREPIEEMTAKLCARIEWRRQRRSLPKCLVCGSTRIATIDDISGEDFPHPKTGERVVIAEMGMMSTAAWHARFTPEGDILFSELR